MHKRADKIYLSDPPFEMVRKMAQGNPGATFVCVAILKDNPIRGISAFLNMDDMGMRGPAIWVGYKDFANENLADFIMAVKTRSPEMVRVIQREGYHAQERGASSVDEQAPVPITVQRDPAMKCAVCGHSEQEFLDLKEKLERATLVLGSALYRLQELGEKDFDLTLYPKQVEKAQQRVEELTAKLAAAEARNTELKQGWDDAYARLKQARAALATSRTGERG
jgi:cell division protein FtsB